MVRFSRAVAEATAESLTKGDDDGWTYVAEGIEGSDWWRIAIYDDAGELVAYW